MPDESRRRLVIAADAELRRIERDLHDGVQQHLVGLAVKVQLARRLLDGDISAARALLDDLQDDVREALDETRKLAQSIYPPLLEAGGLGAALRAAVVDLGVRARIDVTEGSAWPPEVAGAAYFCCVAALERIPAGATAAVTVCEDDGALAFAVEYDGQAMVAHDLAEARDRVEALGGLLTISSDPAGGTRISGSLPVPR